MSRAEATVVQAKLVPERDSAISDELRVSTDGRTSSTDRPPTDARRSWRNSSSVLPENMQPVITVIEPARLIRVENSPAAGPRLGRLGYRSRLMRDSIAGYGISCSCPWADGAVSA